MADDLIERVRAYCKANHEALVERMEALEAALPADAEDLGEAYIELHGEIAARMGLDIDDDNVHDAITEVAGEEF